LFKTSILQEQSFLDEYRNKHIYWFMSTQ